MNSYTIPEVAEQLGISQKIVRRYIASGQLKAQKTNNAYRITEEQYKDFVEGAKGQLFLKENAEERKHPSAAKSTEDDVNWTDITAQWSSTKQSDMTFVDLFCGAGGLSKGLEMSGLQGVCGLDFFKEAGETYRRNFHHPFVYGDITQKDCKEQFYDTVKKQLAGRHRNIVAGGFPCQGFSMAGNRIADDPRNSLYKEMLEIVNTLQPDFVICENVKGLRSMLNGAVERKIIEDYKKIGYEMNVTTLCAADYYTPQKRERVIFIGNRLGLKNYHPKPILNVS